MLTALTGINAFVFTSTSGQPAGFALLYCVMAMAVVLTGILVYSRIRKFKKTKTASSVRIPK